MRKNMIHAFRVTEIILSNDFHATARDFQDTDWSTVFPFSLSSSYFVSRKMKEKERKENRGHFQSHKHNPRRRAVEREVDTTKSL